MSEELYLSNLVSSLKNTLNGGKISPDNCMQLLSKGMIFVEKLAVLSGAQKKKQYGLLGTQFAGWKKKQNENPSARARGATRA